MSDTFVTPWTVVCQASLSMGFHRQENWSGLPFPSSGDLPDPGVETGPPALQADSLPTEPPVSFTVPAQKLQYKVFASIAHIHTLRTGGDRP